MCSRDNAARWALGSYRASPLWVTPNRVANAINRDVVPRRREAVVPVRCSTVLLAPTFALAFNSLVLFLFDIAGWPLAKRVIHIIMLAQNDVHPALRHPRPVTRDTAKAQRMLGLIADSEEVRLQREKSFTTRWLERPFYAHLDVSDVESGKESDDDDSSRALDARKPHRRR